MKRKWLPLLPALLAVVLLGSCASRQFCASYVAGVYRKNDRGKLLYGEGYLSSLYGAG